MMIGIADAAGGGGPVTRTASLIDGGGGGSSGTSGSSNSNGIAARDPSIGSSAFFFLEHQRQAEPDHACARGVYLGTSAYSS